MRGGGADYLQRWRCAGGGVATQSTGNGGGVRVAELRASSGGAAAQSTGSGGLIWRGRRGA